MDGLPAVVRSRFTAPGRLFTIMVTQASQTRSEDSKRLHVLLPQPPPSDALAILHSHLDPGVVLHVGEVQPEVQIDVLVQGRPSREQLEEHPSLGTLVVPYAGIPGETRALLLDARPELVVCNLHHNAAAVAELAMALFLAAAKSVIPVDRAFRSHDWRSRYDGAPTLLLDGKAAVIFGYGAIGARIARACDALGMHVHAMRRHASRPHESFVQIHEPEERDQILEIADALFIALPLTPETEGLLGTNEIGKLPRSCVLVNIGRGAIVDETALFEALRTHRIAAAGIDVWYRYPRNEDERSGTPPSQHPFHQLDNVVMSPHRGGAFRIEELERHRMTDLARTLNALARQEPPPHRVDIRAGY
jgi:phosphoglycerate dehydrogenase-like enzyme